jgi:ADP-ribosylglycohydrolase
MLGAIIGDIVGSVYEWNNIKSTDFPLFGEQSTFTDDTVMSLAVAQWLTEDKKHTFGRLVKTMLSWGRRYPDRGYGSRFNRWLMSTHPQPYGSYGNGSAMRVSAVGFYAQTLDETLQLSEMSASVTHDHKEGIKGAQAIASAIFLAKTGKSKEEIKQYIVTTFGYNLDRTCDEVRPFYMFNETCQGSVPEAIIAFMDSTDFESAIRLAISLGGDSDTIACMAGGIAEAYYKEIPATMIEEALERLPDDALGIVKSIDTIEFTDESETSLRLSEDFPEESNVFPEVNGISDMMPSDSFEEESCYEEATPNITIGQHYFGGAPSTPMTFDIAENIEEQPQETYLPVPVNHREEEKYYCHHQSPISYRSAPSYSSTSSMDADRGEVEAEKSGALGRLFSSRKRQRRAEPEHDLAQDKVSSAIYAPSEVKAGDALLVQVFLYMQEETGEVEAKARLVDGDAVIRNYVPLRVMLKMGDNVTVRLKMPAQVSVDVEMKSLRWEHHFASCEFSAHVAADIHVETILGTVILLVKELPMGEMTFKTKVLSAPHVGNYAPVDAYLYHKIFISYSHRDVDKVKFIAEAYKALGGLDYFFDRHTLATGQLHYSKTIYKYIDEADLFILCWSKHSAASHWVEEERKRALARALKDDTALKIYPIMISPKAPLPNDMAGVYNFGVLE